MEKKILLPYSLPPGVAFPADFKAALKKANTQYSKTHDFQKYLETLQKLLNLPDYVEMSENEKMFFGGFIEGEGSFSVSAKKSPSSRFGVYFDPEFSITQHVNGSSHLFRCLCLFRTGFIAHKNKSHATLVFRIENRETLKQKVIPFITKYVNTNACIPKKVRFQRWCKLLALFEEGAHQDQQRFMYEMGPLWDELRMQKGQVNESFKSLEDFQQYVVNHVQFRADKKQSSF